MCVLVGGLVILVWVYKYIMLVLNKWLRINVYIVFIIGYGFDMQGFLR